MNSTNKLLDMYMEAVHVTSLAAAGRKLGLTGPALSNWKNGTSHAQPEAVEEMAKAIGLDPDEWVLRVQAERDEQVNPRRAKVWLRCAQRISGTAAGVALALGLAVYTPVSKAQTGVYNNATRYTLCEVLFGVAARPPRRILGITASRNDKQSGPSCP